MTKRLLLVVAAVAACNQSHLPPAPEEISAGPVRIATGDLTITFGGRAVSHFVSLGVAAAVDPAHYYDPRGDAEAVLAPIATTRGLDGDWLVLEGGTRMRLTECAIPDCAVLELDASAHARAVQLQLALPHGDGEPAYGTGDAAGGVDVAGSVREMQLRIDMASASGLNETHVPVPLVLWPRRGAGMFVADDRPGAIDVAKTAADRMTATFTLPARGVYRVHLFAAAEPLELVRRYVALTARPAVPPRWAFAPQQWRNVWTSSDEMRGDAAEMRARGIPGSVMWIDNPWQTGYNTFVVDEQRFVDPRGLIADLAAQGYKVLFWSTPYVGTTPAIASDHADGVAKKLFVTDDGGIAIDYPWANGPGAMVDFTAAGATAWWRERIQRVLALGASGFKLDFGEEIVPDIGGTVFPMQLAAGDNSTHHARYSAGYHDAYLGALPPGDGFLITRAGAWGEQATNTAIWPGDLDSDFTEFGAPDGGKRTVGGLPTAISRGLSLSVSGYPFYGSDIGGFRGFPTTEALLRWSAYAAYGTIMQLGGGGKNHNPWDDTLFEPGADAIYKVHATTHMQLNPLLWTLALAAGRDGTPVTRPARFVYDCACDDAMFLLGDDILVAPVITQGAATRSVVLPEGAWVDRATGELAMGDGKTARTVPAPLGAIPTWHRAGSIVPQFARTADTLVPASAPGVTSYADRAIGRELRLVYAPGAGIDRSTTTVLHDGARAVTAAGGGVAVTGGTEYDVFTLDVDGRMPGPFTAPAGVTVDGVALPEVADVAACPAPGCWHVDPGTKHFEARVFAPQGQTKAIAVN